MDITIRAARPDDLDRVSYIENTCFPAAEAATYDSLKERLAAFKHSFLVAEKDGQVIGMVNGCVTHKRQLVDELYDSTQLHDDTAPYQMIFGLDVLPEYQHQGIAAKLMRAYEQLARRRDKELITLTCKKRLVPFYEQLGYKFEGESVSTHGGVTWYDMTLFLKQP